VPDHNNIPINKLTLDDLESSKNEGPEELYAGPPRASHTALAEADIAKKKLQLKHNFTYHAPGPGQQEKYTALRAKALELALLIHELTPDCREQSLAFTHLEESVFWANASIARNP
jgi:hypothetical protein